MSSLTVSMALMFSSAKCLFSVSLSNSWRMASKEAFKSEISRSETTRDSNTFLDACCASLNSLRRASFASPNCSISSESFVFSLSVTSNLDFNSFFTRSKSVHFSASAFEFPLSSSTAAFKSAISEYFDFTSNSLAVNFAFTSDNSFIAESRSSLTFSSLCSNKRFSPRKISKFSVNAAVSALDSANAFRCDSASASRFFFIFSRSLRNASFVAFKF